jgi:hypothetical protein
MENMPRDRFANRQDRRQLASRRPVVRLDRNARVRLLIACDHYSKSTRPDWAPSARLRPNGETWGRGGRQGALSAAALKVMRTILRLASNAAGTAWPSLDTLADYAGVGRATAARAVGMLESAGFIERRARWQKFRHGAQVLVVRDSNEYVPCLPESQSDAVPRTHIYEYKKDARIRPTKRGVVAQAGAWLEGRRLDIAAREAVAIAAITADRLAGRI